MSFATARPARPGNSAAGPRYACGYALVDFRDGNPVGPHPVIVRLDDGLMVACTHTRRGWRPVPLPPNWFGDGDRRVGYAKPRHFGRWELTSRTRRDGLRPLCRAAVPAATLAFEHARDWANGIRR